MIEIRSITTVAIVLFAMLLVILYFALVIIRFIIAEQVWYFIKIIIA